jgi:hypothetical protein
MPIFSLVLQFFMISLFCNYLLILDHYIRAIVFVIRDWYKSRSSHVGLLRMESPFGVLGLG